MNLAIISPVSGLERYSSLSKVHLVLPQITNPKYWEYYKKHRELGDLVVLDNGAYEGVDQNSVVKRILKCWQLCEAQVVVLPDLLLHDWEESMNCSNAAYEALIKYLPSSVEFMYVPQAKVGEKNTWWLGLYTAMREMKGKFKWIGIPRALATDIAQDPLARILAARGLSTHYKLWCLGMVRGDYRELGYLADEGVIGCDSSAPVWRGWKSQLLSQTVGQNFDPVDFEAPWPPENLNVAHQTIMTNLEVCGVCPKPITQESTPSS